jgi:hypothetical protein
MAETAVQLALFGTIGIVVEMFGGKFPNVAAYLKYLDDTFGGDSVRYRSMFAHGRFTEAGAFPVLRGMACLRDAAIGVLAGTVTLESFADLRAEWAALGHVYSDSEIGHMVACLANAPATVASKSAPKGTRADLAKVLETRKETREIDGKPVEVTVTKLEGPKDAPKSKK